MALDDELMKILVCPRCKGEIRLTESQDGLECAACALVYPIREDIPVMLISEAQPLGQ
jgi:uncharacterized protein YbaR (Trm112 family)